MDSCVSRLSAINDKTLASGAKNSPSIRPSYLKPAWRERAALQGGRAAAFDRRAKKLGKFVL
jgi:hypothetical protein